MCRQVAAALWEVQQLQYRAATSAAAPGPTSVPPPDSAAARANDLFGESSPVFGPALEGEQPLVVNVCWWLAQKAEGAAPLAELAEGST